MAGLEDYTKYKKADGVTKCPHCGRNGLMSDVNKRRMVLHKAVYTPGYLGSFYKSLRDYCVIQPDGSGRNITAEEAT